MPIGFAAQIAELEARAGSLSSVERARLRALQLQQARLEERVAAAREAAQAEAAQRADRREGLAADYMQAAIAALEHAAEGEGDDV